jgi:predicted DCC family thiol-disulfide oxidoreductase YuxK
MMKNIWQRWFLEERPSVSLSFFRIIVALTVALHVLPTFTHMDENYLPTAFKAYNTNFFTVDLIQWVQKSPEWFIDLGVGIFCFSCFFFFIGFLSQASGIALMTASYYFYALNSFHVGTLSWDILLVTLFLMCITPYPGDYFSIDCLRCKEEGAYKRSRPFFVQRLLQLQIAFTFFYTALYKISSSGNWLTGNPIYYLMNNHPTGVTKYFLLREFLMDKPQLCYMIGIAILMTELLMVGLLFNRRTRMSAIYLGIFFHILLILAFDVPAIFFFLFPAQLLLFINPKRIVRWIEQKRKVNESSPLRAKLFYDGHCQFCQGCVRLLKAMDLFAVLEYCDFHQSHHLSSLHQKLNQKTAASQIHLLEADGQLYGGFDVFKRICFLFPMLYPLIPIVYFPGMGLIGPMGYRWVAKNRFLFHFNAICKTNSCFRH